MDATNSVLAQFEKDHAVVSEMLTAICESKPRKTSAASSMFVSYLNTIITTFIFIIIYYAPLNVHHFDNCLTFDFFNSTDVVVMTLQAYTL